MGLVSRGLSEEEGAQVQKLPNYELPNYRVEKSMKKTWIHIETIADRQMDRLTTKSTMKFKFFDTLFSLKEHCIKLVEKLSFCLYNIKVFFGCFIFNLNEKYGNTNVNLNLS